MIDQLVDKDRTMIMFFDEGRLGLRSTTMRMWAEKGKPLKTTVRQGFKNFYGYSAVCPFNDKNFSLILPGVNTENMNVFLDELHREFIGTKIFLIMDRAGWHKSSGLKKYKNIEFIFQPPYSPELNPIEKLWEWLKKERQHNFFYNSLESLMEAICDEYIKLKPKDYMSICHCNYLPYNK